ncbi:hypothetical protein NWF32_18760 [Pseudomonas qingdaonensis]|nr:hypothetical protein [Pseudomonas qingdaonensis]
MTDNATGLGKDVTVVLLGHEEQGYRERALHYYKTQDLACAVVEHASSNLTGDACTQGLQALLSQLATPFVSLALDTDFVRVQALEAAAEHLHAHPQCQLAQGYVLGYAPAASRWPTTRSAMHLMPPLAKTHVLPSSSMPPADSRPGVRSCEYRRCRLCCRPCPPGSISIPGWWWCRTRCSARARSSGWTRPMRWCSTPTAG